MNTSLTRIICRTLIVLIAWTPFQLTHAGIIPTDQAIVSTHADRAMLLSTIERADVAGQLKSLGVDLASARERVAAMTDGEVRSLAGQLQAVPAGGDGLVILVLVGVILWLVLWRR